MGIRKAVLDLHLLKTKQEWIDEGNALYRLKRYEEALAAYEQVIRLDPKDALLITVKAILSIASIATRRLWQPMSRPYVLILTMQLLTTIKALLSII